MGLVYLCVLKKEESCTKAMVRKLHSRKLLQVRFPGSYLLGNKVFSRI